MTEALKEEAKRVLREESDALLKACDLIDENIAGAAKFICESDRLIVTGVGKSGMVARKIAATFSSTGVSAAFLHPVDALHGDLGLIKKGDAVILLSKSGSTEEIVRLVPFIKMRQAGIIAIVGNTKSYLAGSSDFVLNATVDREACPLNLAPTSSALVSLALGDALAVTCMMINKFSADDFARLHPLGQLGRNISLQVKDIMHSNSSLPIIRIGSSFKDALIEISNKGLGCVCVCDDDNKLLGILTDGDVRRILHKDFDIMNLDVDRIMTSGPVTINEDAYLAEALALMENRESQINVLPVVDKNNLCTGVVRLHDIIRSGL